jgi:hypothetical protein
MDSKHYSALAMDAFAKLEKLQQERESIEAEAMKLEQLIAATANMLPDDTREKVMLRLTTLRELFRRRDVGLTDAIRTILRKAAGDCLTATNVRDRLISFGFDFTDYSTNPLASISTTLRRMKPEEVETTTVDGGVAAYRWVSKSLAVRVTESQAGRNQGFWAAQEVLAGWKKTGLEPPPKLDAALKKK